MQYIVTEFQSTSSQPRGEMIFKSMGEAIKYFQKVNQTERIFLGEREGTLAQLESCLKERLSTVVLRSHLQEKIRWIVTAFE